MRVVIGHSVLVAVGLSGLLVVWLRGMVSRGRGVVGRLMVDHWGVVGRGVNYRSVMDYRSVVDQRRVVGLSVVDSVMSHSVMSHSLMSHRCMVDGVVSQWCMVDSMVSNRSVMNYRSMVGL